VWSDTKPDSHSYGRSDWHSKLQCYSNSYRYIYRERDCDSNGISKCISLSNAISYSQWNTFRIAHANFRR